MGLETENMTHYCKSPGWSLSFIVGRTETINAFYPITSSGSSICNADALSIDDRMETMNVIFKGFQQNVGTCGALLFV